MISVNKKAVIWSGIDKASTFVVNFIIQLVLARLLCPDDYAIVAMLAIFFAISQSFIDAGLPTALIQKQDCTQKDYSSVFYFNICIGALVYALFFWGAPFISEYYEMPALTKVTRIYSLNLLISSFASVHRVILTKNLLFKKMAYIGLGTSVFSAIPAIVMAYWGLGYWALISQYLLASILTCLFLFYQTHWRPSSFFSIKSLKEIAPFGFKIMVVHIFHAVYNNIYTMLIGKKFTPNDLGYYDRGKTLSSFGAIGFSDFYTRALFPIQAKFQDDSEKLQNTYLKSVALSCYLIMPISAFLCIYSKSVVFCLLGEQWEMAWWIISILCIGYIFYPLQAINVNMIKVKGQGNLLLSSEILKKALGIVLALIVIRFDFKYVIYGWTATAIMEFLIGQVYCYKLGKFMFRFRDFILPALISFTLALITRFAIELLTDDKYIIFFVGGISYVLSYLVVTFKKLKNLY